MVKPEQMRNGSRHEDLKGDTVALAKLVMKEGEKPGKFLLPHGMILLGWWLRMFMADNPYGIQNQSSFRIMELSVDHCGNYSVNHGGSCTAMPIVWFSSTLSRRPLAVEILQLRQPLVEVRALLPDLVQPNCLR